MAHQIREAHTVPSPSTPRPASADTLQSERDHLQALRRRLGAAAEALSRIHNELQTRASGCRDWDEDREQDGSELGGPDPEGCRQ